MYDGWRGERIGYKFADFEKHLISKGYIFRQAGSFRRTFVKDTPCKKGKCVIKVPYFSDGIIDNMVEAKAYKTYFNNPTSDGIHLAPCRLLPNGCLMMVEVDLYVNHFPEWSTLIDSDQVGTYKERIVAYDYALDIPERVQWEKDWDLQSEFFNSIDFKGHPSVMKLRAQYQKAG